MTDQAQAPIAQRIPHETVIHGDTLVDPYFWLRDRNNPAVIEYLNAENTYLTQALQHTEALQQQLVAEMRGRIQEEDTSVPVPNGAYEYYSRLAPGQQYPIMCRKHRDPDSPEEILLDQNQLAAEHAYFELGMYKVSPNHQLLAYSVDTSGAEMYTLHIKDLITGEVLADEIVNTYYGLEWANDNRTLYYTVLDDAKRPYQVYRHTIGQDSAQDTLVYEEPDEIFHLLLTKTRSDAYLLISLTSTNISEVWFASADNPHASFTVVQPRTPELEYKVDHHDERFFIVTNDQALNFKLVAAPIATPSREYWRDILPHRTNVMLDSIDVFRDYVAVYEREHGLQQIRIITPAGREVRTVDFPEPVYSYTPGPNEQFDAAFLRFTYTSLVTPDSVIDYDMSSGSWQVRKQNQIPSGYDPAQYQSERVFAQASDGTQVPISLVYKRDIVRDGNNPCLLYGYGSYGANVDPTFSTHRLSLLERGFVYAIAHIRGGAEMGRAWYDNGRLLNKRNTFTDFIACAEHLIAAGYTSSVRLSIMGGSAGGLLMGAVVTMRPMLFKAVIAHVPFVDVINTSLDPSLPLVVTEYEQWGNPADIEQYKYMLSYSPYDNTVATDYPNLFVTSGLNDPRVAFWEPAKWVAKLRSLKTDQNLLVLKTNMSTGHFGASGRYAEIDEIAQEYAFLIDTVGA